MDVTILPFSSNHAEPAAALLAARHRRDRRAMPNLPLEYEDPAATLPIVQALLTTDGTSGVAALRGGKVVGYLLGTPQLGSPTSTFAGMLYPRAAEIPFAGHAAEANGASMLYGRLYASLAQQWVADGLVGHYITVPIDRDVADIWLDFGFARFITMAVRPTTPLRERDDRPSAKIEARLATADDEGAVQALVTELFRSFADSPIFVPFLPETSVERSRFVVERLADPACPYWLAFQNGRLVGLQMFEEPNSSLWHQSPLESVPRSVYLFLACTAPEARGTGVGVALFAHSMAWAREAGYDYCMLHFLTASRAAPFWRGLGFQPVSHWLRRSVDERVTWAHRDR